VDDLLLELAHSTPADVDVSRGERVEPIAHPSSEAESWVNILHGSLGQGFTCHGAMRTIGRIFLSTGPNEEQRVRWLMDTVRSARARLAEHADVAVPV
jgi:hypothetical protein